MKQPNCAIGVSRHSIRYNAWTFAYSLVAAGPPRGRKRVMILFDMEIQEMSRGEVLTALRAAIDMGLSIVHLVVLVRGEREGLAVRREGTLHNLGDRLRVTMKDLIVWLRCGSSWRRGS